MQHQYRSPLDFTAEDLQAASKSYERLIAAFDHVPAASIDELKASEDPLITSLITALCDDLTIAKCFGLIFEHLKTVGANQASLVKGFLVHLLGLDMKPLPHEQVVITPEILGLLEEREQARLAKNWARA